jgi:hypothetical protein
LDFRTIGMAQILFIVREGAWTIMNKKMWTPNQHNVQCVKQQGQARLLHYFYFLEKEQDNQEKFPCICKSFEPQLQFFGMTMANCSRISN